MKNIPLLILLHGTRLTGAQWATYAERLAGVADVVAPDLPGHGTRAEQPFTLDAAVRVVEDLVESAAERPVFLAGHSLGGFVGMGYAERHPRRLAGLALIGSATEPAGPGAIVYRMMARLWALAGPARMRRFDALTLGRVADPRVWAAIQAGGEYFDQVPAAWAEVMRHCGSQQLRRVACPVLVLGGRWDQIHLQAQRFAAAAPRGQAVTVPGRTHMWPMTHPAEVADALARWIGGVLAGGMGTAQPPADVATAQTPSASGASCRRACAPRKPFGLSLSKRRAALRQAQRERLSIFGSARVPGIQLTSSPRLTGASSYEIRST
ncbi:MAG: alpha/beta hydrolase [Burkholderiaceae bacterium]